MQSSNFAVQTTSVSAMLRAALALSLIGLGVFGFIYSLSATALGQLFFPVQANGSLIIDQGKVVGSKWVAQPFEQAQYFHPRPSAANYDPMAMAGSNLALTNPVLTSQITDRLQQRAQIEHVAVHEIPADLVSSSASGIDPEISLAAANIQVPRIAAARQMSTAAVERILMQQFIPANTWLAAPARVNVLTLNLALDQHRSP